MKNNILKSLVALSFLGASVSTSAAVLNVSNGILIGATGVSVGGTFYDVTFGDGLILDSVTAFTTATTALEASQALQDQVFIDNAQGQFNSNPALTNGCSSSNRCWVITPTAILRDANSNFVYAGIFYNFANPASDLLNTNFVVRDENTSIYTDRTVARWSLSSNSAAAVPESKTYAMFLTGMGLLGFTLRRRKI